MKSLYSLLHPESLLLLKDMFKSAPFSTLEVPALYIGSFAGTIEVNEAAEYSAIPTGFFLGQNPFTGNTSLILKLDLEYGIQNDVPGTVLLAERAAALGGSIMPPCLFVSDGIHEIPRHYRNFLNSLENTFARERYVFAFHAEFVVEM
jgi:hypothetical protein